MMSSKMLLMLKPGEGNAVTYELLDEFTTTESAPLASPRTCDGTGEITLTQPDSVMSIPSGDGMLVSGSVSLGNNHAARDQITRVAGLGIFEKIIDGTTMAANRGIHLGWDNSNANNGVYDGFRCWGTSGGKQQFMVVAENTTVFYTGYVYTAPYTLGVILRESGAYIVANDGTDWRLLWVAEVYSANPYRKFEFAAQTSTPNYKIGKLVQLNLPDNGYTAWQSDGLVTDSDASPSQGDTLTMAADAWCEFAVDTLPSAGSIQVAFRRQDDNNCWYLDIDSAGKPILYENVSGTPQARISGNNGDISASERVVVTLEDESISIHGGTSQIGSPYTSAVNFKTETGWKLLSTGTGGVISDAKNWPGNVSAHIPSEI